MRAGIDWLREAVAAGEIHTVRVSFADRLGVWRGKRVPADVFLEASDRPVGFCDGMLVVDVHADLVQETPYSNYGTGYPDVYVHPSLDGIRPVGWADGEAYAFGPMRDEHGRTAAVAPRSALELAAARGATEHGIQTVRLSLSGRLMHEPHRATDLELGIVPDRADELLASVAAGLDGSGITVETIATDVGGRFSLGLAAMEPNAAGEAGVVAKSALKELARAAGFEAIFMTRVARHSDASVWCVEVPVAAHGLPSLEIVQSLVEDARGLLSPSITAFRAGPLAVAIDVEAGYVRIAASAEASPQTAIAVAIATVCEAGGGRRGSGDVASLAASGDRLVETRWLSEWLGPDLPVNSAALLHAEQALFDAAVTDWELDRYWKAS